MIQAAFTYYWAQRVWPDTPFLIDPHAAVDDPCYANWVSALVRQYRWRQREGIL